MPATATARTLSSFDELQPTPEMLAHELSLRIFKTQYKSVAYGHPMHRLEVMKHLEPIKVKSPALAKAIRENSYYRAALWLARRK